MFKGQRASNEAAKGVQDEEADTEGHKKTRSHMHVVDVFEGV